MIFYFCKRLRAKIFCWSNYYLEYASSRTYGYLTLCCWEKAFISLNKFLCDSVVDSLKFFLLCQKSVFAELLAQGFQEYQLGWGKSQGFNKQVPVIRGSFSCPAMRLYGTDLNPHVLFYADLQIQQASKINCEHNLVF